jgi:Predicted Rossmann fold nucleotide-binding protein involved in DNA uptake
MPRVRPRRDLEAVHALGGRFVVPGDAEWPSQLDDLGDARPVGLWVRGAADLRRWALRSVALVGARACTPYGAHMAAVLGGGLAERGWVVVSGAAFVLYPVTVVAEARCHPCGGVGIECPVLAAA